MSKHYLQCAFSFIFIFIALNASNATEYEVKSINVLFRHGDCIPDVQGMYPKDPYYTYDFTPIESGGLTDVGKRQGYALGKFLRDRYNDTLGKLYIGSKVYSRSTDFDRTKMSLLLVLASLYRPKYPQRWNPALDWQPIPINYSDVHFDPLLYSTQCPEYKAELRKVKNTIEYKEGVSRFQNLMIELSDFTGLNITSTSQISGLFNTLLAETRQNFTLPEWTKPYFPNGLITEATLFDYKMSNYNDRLKRLSGGMILRKIINDMNNIKQNKKVPKIYLYSAHGFNLISLLSALGLWESQMPDYSSAIILELLKKDSAYYIKVVYYLGISPKYEILTIPGCSELCPLEDFTKLLHNVLPHDYIEECYINFCLHDDKSLAL